MKVGPLPTFLTTKIFFAWRIRRNFFVIHHVQTIWSRSLALKVQYKKRMCNKITWLHFLTYKPTNYRLTIAWYPCTMQGRCCSMGRDLPVSVRHWKDSQSALKNDQRPLEILSFHRRRTCWPILVRPHFHQQQGASTQQQVVMWGILA